MERDGRCTAAAVDVEPAARDRSVTGRPLPCPRRRASRPITPDAATCAGCAPPRVMRDTVPGARVCPNASQRGWGDEGREVPEEGEGGGGSGTQKFVYQKWPDKSFPIANFRFFPLSSLWSGGGGVQGGGYPPPTPTVTRDGGPGPSVAPRYAGGAGGVRALYICIQLYIDELSPANPLIPSIALASRT